MPKLSKKSIADCDAFFHMVETEASHYPVEIFKIGENGSSQGFLAIKRALSPQRKSEIIDAVCPTKTSSFPDLPPSRTGKDSLKKQLRLELDRVKKSRLPCSLFFIKISDQKKAKPPESALGLLEEHAPANAHIALQGNSTFSLLFPGLTIKKSIRQAKIFQKNLSPLRIYIGLAVCMFKNVPDAETFISMAEKELKQAQKDNSGISHSFQESEADSCQVTAEERSQLFSFLKAGNS